MQLLAPTRDLLRTLKLILGRICAPGRNGSGGEWAARPRRNQRKRERNPCLQCGVRVRARATASRCRRYPKEQRGASFARGNLQRVFAFCSGFPIFPPIPAMGSESADGEEEPLRIGNYKRKSLRVRQVKKRPRLEGEGGDEAPWRKGIQGQLKRAASALGEEQFSALRLQYEEAGREKRTGEQDGIIVGVMTQGVLADSAIRTVFGVGSQRMARLRKARQNLPKVACAARGIREVFFPQ
jgi:hypothetical protein